MTPFSDPRWQKLPKQWRGIDWGGRAPIVLAFKPGPRAWQSAAVLIRWGGYTGWAGRGNRQYVPLEVAFVDHNSSDVITIFTGAVTRKKLLAHAERIDSLFKRENVADAVSAARGTLGIWPYSIAFPAKRRRRKLKH